VLSLSAKGLTTGEIAAHFAEVFGARVSKDTISRITEKVIGEMTEWQNRPLDRGQCLTVVANPDRKGFQCPDTPRTRCRPKSSVDISS
jgi:hypothetical protein